MKTPCYVSRIRALIYRRKIFRNHLLKNLLSKHNVSVVVESKFCGTEVFWNIFVDRLSSYPSLPSRQLTIEPINIKVFAATRQAKLRSFHGIAGSTRQTTREVAVTPQCFILTALLLFSIKRKLRPHAYPSTSCGNATGHHARSNR